MVRRAFILSLCLWLTACAGQFFHPMTRHVGLPSDRGLTYEDVWLTTSDGVRLHGWYLPAQGRSRGTVLFLHGNAENISTHIASVVWLPARGYDVLLIDYRGFGASGGRPSVEGALRDINAAMVWLAARVGQSRKIVLFGQSLGAALAIYYAAHGEHRQLVRALVADSAFASYRDIAREKLAAFWLTWPLQVPLSWTVSDRFSPIQSVGQLAPIPVVFIHGDRDRIIPVSHSRRLFLAASDPRAFWVIIGGRHIAAFQRPSTRLRLLEFLERLPEKNPIRPVGGD